jgi:hypothetical protein
MMFSVLVFASAIAVTEVVVKNLRRNEILGNVVMVSFGVRVSMKMNGFI